MEKSYSDKRQKFFESLDSAGCFWRKDRFYKTDEAEKLIARFSRNYIRIYSKITGNKELIEKFYNNRAVKEMSEEIRPSVALAGYVRANRIKFNGYKCDSVDAVLKWDDNTEQAVQITSNDDGLTKKLIEKEIALKGFAAEPSNKPYKTDSNAEKRKQFEEMQNVSDGKERADEELLKNFERGDWDRDKAISQFEYTIKQKLQMGYAGYWLLITTDEYFLNAIRDDIKNFILTECKKNNPFKKVFIYNTSEMYRSDGALTDAVEPPDGRGSVTEII